MFGREKPVVKQTPAKVKKLDPYAEIKRVGLFKWQVKIHRGEDDDSYRYYRHDGVKYFNYTYYYWTEAKAKRKAKLFLARAKERIEWSRTITRYDLE